MTARSSSRPLAVVFGRYPARNGGPAEPRSSSGGGRLTTRKQLHVRDQMWSRHCQRNRLRCGSTKLSDQIDMTQIVPKRVLRCYLARALSGTTSSLPKLSLVCICLKNTKSKMYVSTAMCRTRKVSNLNHISLRQCFLPHGAGESLQGSWKVQNSKIIRFAKRV